MDISAILDGTLDGVEKGIPGGASLRLRDVGKQGWNLLNEDLPLPVCVLKRDAIEANERLMAKFLAATGAILAPHGKTTMSPQLFKRQLDAGAWAITLANIAQVQVARRFGVKRIVLANQLIGKQAIRYVVDELARDESFEFFCLIDSHEGLAALVTAARAKDLRGRIGVFLEGGMAGMRTGVRTHDAAIALARAIKAAEPFVALRGVEGFEGLVSGAEGALKVTAFVDFLAKIAESVDAENLWGEPPAILTAGGSAFYDIVARRFSSLALTREKITLIRSGCYLTHDSKMYDLAFDQIAHRMPEFAREGRPQSALEVWAYVQSRPEPTRVLVTLGKRDTAYDPFLPEPKFWYRPGSAPRAPQALAGHVCVSLNDQHGYLDVPADSPLHVGDMVGFGVSHPCLTFDKWRVMPIVDRDYGVVDAIRTYF